MPVKKALGVLLAGVLVIAPLNAFASVKAGVVCKKAGSTATVNGKKFTCIKSGKKLVWNKGVAIAKPKPAVTPTPVATPTPTPEPTPSPQPPAPVPAPIIEKTPTGFNDLVENFKGIYINVWNSTNNKITSSPAIDVKQNIVVGPNTKLPNEEIPSMFVLGTRFFGGYLQPKKFDAVYFSFDDREWAIRKLLELYGNPSLANDEVARSCQSRERCSGASASVPLPDHGRSNFAVPIGGHQHAYGSKGGIEIHEYAHMVQFMQFQGKPTYKIRSGLGLLPNWFVEGHAHLAGNAASANSLEQYQRYRSFWFNTIPEGFPDYSPSSIELFYEKLAPGKFDPTVQQYVYSVGYFSVEALASIKGVDSPMELIKLVSDGQTWEQAFLKVYGITWKEAAPILAKTVSRMYLERF
jgi:hypothetical protein